MPTHNISPSQWGACVWRALRWFAEGFPDAPTDAERGRYKDFFASLAHVLPCEKCQQHYQQNWTDHPIQLQDRSALLHWLYDIYKVSAQKPDFTFDEWLDKTASGGTGGDISTGTAALSAIVGFGVGWAACSHFQGK